MPLYRYDIRPYRVSASIDAENGNDTQAIEYEGAATMGGRDVAAVKFRLSDSFGAFGHRFNPEQSTPIDLDAALMSTFGPEAVDRGGAVPSYDPDIPDGAQT